VSRSRIPLSIAASIRRGVSPNSARSTINLVTLVMRTPSRHSRSADRQSLVVRTSVDVCHRRDLGTTNSTCSSSGSNPSSPHHAAAAAPASAESRPSTRARARTLMSKVSRAAECRHTPGTTGTHSPALARRCHCRGVIPAAATSSSVISWCPISARANSARSTSFMPHWARRTTRFGTVPETCQAKPTETVAVT